MRPAPRLALGLAIAAAAACSGEASRSADAGIEPTRQDLESIALELELAGRTGHAVIVARPATGAGTIDLDVEGLDLTAVSRDGVALEPSAVEGVLAVPVVGPEPVELTIDYGFTARPSGGFDGWMPDPGVTFLWPTYCDNLFPCDEDPADGATFTLAVSGVAEGAIAVYPAAIPSPVPAYTPAIAVGDYAEIALGVTTAGTQVSVFHLPGEAAAAAAGTADLVAVVDFLERTYGAYRFGAKLASVSAPWGPGAFGGMEHHPYFHVASSALDSPEVNAHEAAHGWFGAGVRLSCWEDFVLSEGTVTYLAAHALAAVGGPDLWPGYVAELTGLCDGMDNTIALPDSCGVIDLIDDPLWSSVPYLKGACFFEEVADLIGEATVDGVLGDFYADHLDRPARMDELIEALRAAAGPRATEVDALVDAWLGTVACPADYATRCGS